MTLFHAARRLRLAHIACLLLLLGACRSPQTPSPRLGALPFPGPFTFYRTVDPEHLGHHGAGYLDPEPREWAGGILYTCRAGFLDMAHIRDVADWTRWYAHHVRKAMREGAAYVDLPTSMPCSFRLRLEHRGPSAAAEEDLWPHAIELGGELAWVLSKWHEIATWFGYRSTVVVSEYRSAFTWDDTVSHALGMELAQQALRDTERPFDEVFTELLRARLQELGAVSPERTTEAARAVEGIWWEGGRPMRRHVELGLEEGVIRPWLVEGLAWCDASEPEPFPAPGLASGRRRTPPFEARLELRPAILEAGQIRAVLPEAPRRIHPADHFPLLIDHIRQQVVETYGPDALGP